MLSLFVKNVWIWSNKIIHWIVPIIDNQLNSSELMSY